MYRLRTEHGEELFSSMTDAQSALNLLLQFIGIEADPVDVIHDLATEGYRGCPESLYSIERVKE